MGACSILIISLLLLVATCSTSAGIPATLQEYQLVMNGAALNTNGLNRTKRISLTLPKFTQASTTVRHFFPIRCSMRVYQTALVWDDFSTAHLHSTFPHPNSWILTMLGHTNSLFPRTTSLRRIPLIVPIY